MSIEVKRAPKDGPQTKPRMANVPSSEVSSVTLLGGAASLRYVYEACGAVRREFVLFGGGKAMFVSSGRGRGRGRGRGSRGNVKVSTIRPINLAKAKATQRSRATKTEPTHLLDYLLPTGPEALERSAPKDHVGAAQNVTTDVHG